MKEEKVMLISPAMEILAQGQNMRAGMGLAPINLAGELDALGIETKVLDMSVGDETDTIEESYENYLELPHGNIRVGISVDNLLTKIEKFSPTIVGVSGIYTEQTDTTIEIAKAVKEHFPQVTTIGGGTNTMALHKYFLENGFDFVSFGDGELGIVEFLKNSGAPKGFVYVKDGKMVKTKPLKLEDLDSTKLPLWKAANMKRYKEIHASQYGVYDGEGSYGLETSRGCKRRCNYCHVNAGKKYSEKSIE